jgi:hypothetical protein
MTTAPTTLENDLQILKDKAQSEIGAADTLEDLEQLRIKLPGQERSTV